MKRIKLGQTHVAAAIVVTLVATFAMLMIVVVNPHVQKVKDQDDWFYMVQEGNVPDDYVGDARYNAISNKSSEAYPIARFPLYNMIFDGNMGDIMFARYYLSADGEGMMEIDGNDGTYCIVASPSAVIDIAMNAKKFFLEYEEYKNGGLPGEPDGIDIYDAVGNYSMVLYKASNEYVSVRWGTGYGSRGEPSFCMRAESYAPDFEGLFSIRYVDAKNIYTGTLRALKAYGLEGSWTNTVH